MESRSRLFLVAACLLLVSAGIFAAGTKEPPKEQAASPAASPREKGSDVVNELALPISSSPLTLTYWTYNALPQKLQSMADMPCYKGLAKRSGITYKFIHPAAGQESEQFNLMVASGEYPDLIQYDIPANYPGGAQKAISGKLIISLNDPVSKYSPKL